MSATLVYRLTCDVQGLRRSPECWGDIMVPDRVASIVELRVYALERGWFSVALPMNKGVFDACPACAPKRTLPGETTAVLGEPEPTALEA